MKKEDFFEIFGELDDNIIKEAKMASKKRWNQKPCIRMAAMAAMAACLCFVILATFIIPNMPNSISENPHEDGGIENSFLDGNPNKYNQTADIVPMVCVNHTLYQIVGDQPDMTSREEEFTYLGKIISKVDESQKPTEDFQANDSIIGSKVFQYGEYIVVEIDGQYWLYEMLYEYLDTSP